MADVKPVTVYGLIDPRTNELRYVGKTVFPKNRYRQHLHTGRRKKRNDHVTNWLYNLYKSDVSPEMVEIEVVHDGEWIEAEQHWIAYFRSLGCRLVNHTVGGEGATGHYPSLETRRKMSETQKGKKGHSHTPEERKRISETLKGRPIDPERREKIREATRKAMNEPERKARMAEIYRSRKGHKQSEETITKRANSNRGQKRSLETRRRMSEAQFKKAKERKRMTGECDFRN